MESHSIKELIDQDDKWLRKSLQLGGFIVEKLWDGKLVNGKVYQRDSWSTNGFVDRTLSERRGWMQEGGHESQSQCPPLSYPNGSVLWIHCSVEFTLTNDFMNVGWPKIHPGFANFTSRFPLTSFAMKLLDLSPSELM